MTTGAKTRAGANETHGDPLGRGIRRCYEYEVKRVRCHVNRTYISPAAALRAFTSIFFPYKRRELRAGDLLKNNAPKHCKTCNGSENTGAKLTRDYANGPVSSLMLSGQHPFVSSRGSGTI